MDNDNDNEEYEIIKDSDILEVVSDCDYEAIKYYLKLKGYKHVENSFGDDALIIATRLGHFKIIKLLVEYGNEAANNDSNDMNDINDKILNLNHQNKSGSTALMIAIKEGFIEIAIYLIKSGANVLLKDENGWDPLSLSCEHGYIVLVKLLIFHGANISSREYKCHSTPLIIACMYGHFDICKCIVEEAEIYSNINGHKSVEEVVNEIDIFGCTAIDWSRKLGYYNIVDYLEQYEDI